MGRALIVVDVQNDFCEGGSMGVAGGAQVATGVADLLRRRQQGAAGSDAAYDVVVATRDHHIDPGGHWAAPGTEPDFRTSWPVHCEVGTTGEEFHPELSDADFDAVFLKGAYDAAYSGFDGATDGTPLADWLRERDVEEVDVCGIATDYCVRATALDAASAGFATRVLLDLCAGVAPDSTERTLAELEQAGVQAG